MVMGLCPIHRLERECDTLLLESITETIEIVPHLEAEVIHTPLAPVFFARPLTCALAAHDDGGTVECDVNLWGTAHVIASDDFAP